MSHMNSSLMKSEEERGLNVIPAGCLWQLMKIQRMTKIELERVADHPQKSGCEEGKALESHFCETTCSEVAGHGDANLLISEMVSHAHSSPGKPKNLNFSL